MKAIIKFYLLATIGVLLLTASCKSDDGNPLNGGMTGGDCYKITYQKTATMPYPEISRVKTSQPSTNGYIDNGGTTFYKIECF